MSSSNGCTDVVHGQTVVSDNYGLDGLDTISETLVDEVLPDTSSNYSASPDESNRLISLMVPKIATWNEQNSKLLEKDNVRTTSSIDSSIYQNSDSDELDQNDKPQLSRILKRITCKSNSESKTSTDTICRICHGGESSDDLVKPCKCRGTVALVHLKCLERWLRESSHSNCELCQHHYKIIRQPKYSIIKSIFVFLRHPGTHLKEILTDLLAFSLYTPSAIASTYMLMMICESLLKNNIIVSGSLSSHLIAFSAVFGIAAIDFTYSCWIMSLAEKHYNVWSDWYKKNLKLKVVVSKLDTKTVKRKKPRNTKYLKRSNKV
ncbi:E3 ubiquitin-protein ligase MARCHF3 [Aethina tumida]|uniref:E3 ubiquitin-protein ligase MARCHF3 n=1 Tax=Aethina tumida TaxID=116153 RepID=UPI00096AE008|nr:E3 ubiquitin-protein ligase MARCHF3 [Aethina tumida]